MGVLVVGSIALDTVKTPFGEVQDALGGSAVYFSAAASYFAPVKVVGVVGDDFDMEGLSFLLERDVDLTGVSVEPGRTFRWSGVYESDMNTRETLETQVNVFASFRPSIPDQYKDSPYVFLANIDPELQLDVLRQVHDPKWVVCDTMNFWIEGKKEALIELLGEVNIIILNDSETRQLASETNLIKASKHVLTMGPEVVIVKKGEHGAYMVSERYGLFSIPAFPTESVFDPTGAGDAFAGGFVGYLGRIDHLTGDTLRQAMVYGTVMASFNVEQFSIERLRHLDYAEIRGRFDVLKQLTSFGNGAF